MDVLLRTQTQQTKRATLHATSSNVAISSMHLSCLSPEMPMLLTLLCVALCCLLTLCCCLFCVLTLFALFNFVLLYCTVFVCLLAYVALLAYFCFGCLLCLLTVKMPLFDFKKSCTKKHKRNLPSHITTVNTNTHKESKSKYKVHRTAAIYYRKFCYC